MSKPLTEAQEDAIKIIPRVTAGLSVCGSAFVLGSILLSVYRNRIGRPGTTTAAAAAATTSSKSVVGQRLLVGVSALDLISSMSYVIGDVAYPNSDGGKGNQATCNAQGFLCNLQVGAALYSGFLAW
jgi:hypothetical protein